MHQRRRLVRSKVYVVMLMLFDSRKACDQLIHFWEIDLSLLLYHTSHMHIYIWLYFPFFEFVCVWTYISFCKRILCISFNYLPSFPPIYRPMSFPEELFISILYMPAREKTTNVRWRSRLFHLYISKMFAFHWVKTFLSPNSGFSLLFMLMSNEDIRAPSFFYWIWNFRGKIIFCFIRFFLAFPWLQIYCLWSTFLKSNVRKNSMLKARFYLC